MASFSQYTPIIALPFLLASAFLFAQVFTHPVIPQKPSNAGVLRDPRPTSLPISLLGSLPLPGRLIDSQEGSIFHQIQKPDETTLAIMKELRGQDVDEELEDGNGKGKEEKDDGEEKENKEEDVEEDVEENEKEEEEEKNEGEAKVERASRKRRYALLGGKWNEKALSYYVGSAISTQLPQDSVEEEIRKAFEMWSEVSGLTFTRKTDWRKANIILGFAVRLRLWVDGKGVGVKQTS